MLSKTISWHGTAPSAGGVSDVAPPRFLAYMPVGLSRLGKGVSFVAALGAGLMRRKDSTVRSTQE